MIMNNFVSIFLVATFVAFSQAQEAFPFWNLTAIKSWNSASVPKEPRAEWRLGLASFTSAINKKPKADLTHLTPSSNLTLSYFSVVELDDNSGLRMGPGSAVVLADQSQFHGRDGSNTLLNENSAISCKRSYLTPGNLMLDPAARLTLSEARLYAFLSKIHLGADSRLDMSQRTQFNLIGGSSLVLATGTTLTIARSYIDISGDVSLGERCIVDFKGLDLTMVGGKLELHQRVEFKAESKSALTNFGSTILFTEGSKINLDVQSEFNIERNSSLIMARRDLRLKVEEKAFLKIDQSSHCLMTDDLTVPKQTTLRLDVSATHASVRCYPKHQQLMEEKTRRFP